jgi:hypothetical protein
MINHLSEEQLAKCLVGRHTSEELQHIMECPDCRAELDLFTKSVSSFRGAIQDRIDDRFPSQSSWVPHLAARHAASKFPRWQWALVAAAVVVLMMVPFFTSKQKPQEIIQNTSAPTDPDAIMRAVNLHLSRTVPEPMEPMMALLPNEESAAESGGVQ